MNKLTIVTLLALSGYLAGCSDMPMRSSFTSTSGGAGMDGMTSSGSAGNNNWYNGQQDISRKMYFGG